MDNRRDFLSKVGVAGVGIGPVENLSTSVNNQVHLVEMNVKYEVEKVLDGEDPLPIAVTELPEYVVHDSQVIKPTRHGSKANRQLLLNTERAIMPHGVSGELDEAELAISESFLPTKLAKDSRPMYGFLLTDNVDHPDVSVRGSPHTTTIESRDQKMALNEQESGVLSLSRSTEVAAKSNNKGQTQTTSVKVTPKISARNRGNLNVKE